MRKNRKNLLNGDIKYKRAFFSVSLVLILGCICGTLASFYAKSDRLTEIYDILKGISIADNVVVLDKLSLFTEAFGGYLLAFLVLWVCSFWVYLIPLAFSEVLLRGFKIGFSSGVIVRVLGLKGFFFSGAVTLVQSVIFVPVFIAMAVFSVQSAVQTRKNRVLNKRRYLVKKLAEFFIVATVSLVCGAIEGYIIPYFVLNLL